MNLRKKKTLVRKSILNNVQSFATISAISLIGVSLLAIAASTVVTMSYPRIAEGFEDLKDQPIAQSSLKLSIDSPSAIYLVDSKPGITPGESTLQREAREKAETEAAARMAKSRVAATAASSRSVVARERRVYVDPTSFDAIYAAAEAAYGVDAEILHAIHYVETGCSGSTTKSNPSGATGPMQFLPSTFARHGVDGNGDGIRDVHNLEDSIFSAAAYLKACGYPNLKSAILGYNRSISYYNKVMKVASSLGFQQ